MITLLIKDKVPGIKESFLLVIFIALYSEISLTQLIIIISYYPSDFALLFVIIFLINKEIPPIKLLMMINEKPIKDTNKQLSLLIPNNP